MRRLTILFLALAFAFAGNALAFHDGGVANCSGCHTMHNSQGGEAMNFDAAGSGPGTAVGTGYDDLLLFANATDVCLNCHDGGGSYHIWSDSTSAPNATTANRGGGDFVFLEETNLNDGHGGANNPILGHASGHNVVSAMKGISADPVLSVSPGGSFPASDLACSSCHDPHGTSSFRILNQAGQTVGIESFNTTLEADGIRLFGPGESNTSHNAYKSGYSEWCSTCHGDFHAGSANLVHPSGESLGSDIAGAYNRYNGTTDCIANPPANGESCGSGISATAYLAVVPFEDPGATTGSTAGPSAESKVACMSCHRAHASSSPDAGRWDFNITGLAEDGHESGSYVIPQPYDDGQRSLCNKCHGQDEYDAPL